MEKMDQLERIRRERNLTRKELAEKSGIAEITILALEQGKTNVENIKVSTLLKLAAALGVKGIDLLDNELKYQMV